MKRECFVLSPEFSDFRGHGFVDQVVTETSRGRVYFKASFWPAQLAHSNITQSLLPGEPIEVVGRKGITLLIRPLTSKKKLSINQ
jgi:membrane protein implicated in regulation of membrane protease activity